ncbi:hypothetical protein CDAR_196551 [Caerostris darwini]|uniref:Uncharacterized protein n=1 Tax=Caerostris darwini TaxID=1538125 RepID=A0AAV4PWK9_9ARAC|nr:hypothetical protein CDAR_196551 [Caerostris darwini]
MASNTAHPDINSCSFPLDRVNLDRLRSSVGRLKFIIRENWKHMNYLPESLPEIVEGETVFLQQIKQLLISDLIFSNIAENHRTSNCSNVTLNYHNHKKIEENKDALQLEELDIVETMLQEKMEQIRLDRETAFSKITSPFII